MPKSKYHTHVQPFLEDIKQWKASGWTEERIWNQLNIGEGTWYKYKNMYSELSLAVYTGFNGICKQWQDSMFQKALNEEDPNHYDALKWCLTFAAGYMTGYQRGLLRNKARETDLKELAVAQNQTIIEDLTPLVALLNKQPKNDE